MGPEVSIVIPLHQGASTIVETLDSVAAQTGGARLEVVVVDDRSTDGGPELARGHRVAPVLVKSERAGLPGTRNTGVRRATGRFVTFLDADDLLLPGAIAGRLAVAARVPGAVVVTRHLELRDGRLVPMRRHRTPGVDPRAAFLQHNQLAVHAALVPIELLRDEPPFLEELAVTQEDWGLWLRLSLRGVRFEFVDDEDCVYRIRPGSLSTDTRARTTDALRILEHARRWMEAVPPPERPALDFIRRRTRYAWLRHRAWLALRERDLPAAGLDLARAVAAAPDHLATLPLRLLRRLLP